MSRPDSDFELLQAWRDGDRRAGELLFERHLDAVRGFFHRRVDGDAEDLAQRTFLACVESKTQIRGDASFRTFLFAVARNVLGKHFRGTRSRDDRTRCGVSGVLDRSPSSSMVVAAHEEREGLQDALGRLPTEHRHVLELYYWERRTSAEIAKELGVPHGTARTRIRRAVGLLREDLEHTTMSRRSMALPSHHARHRNQAVAPRYYPDDSATKGRVP
jgi:RNA polymerase sigma factor (sigma-70 family)